ncbi:transglutaminase TgpA family protein [Candidatus Venteria ishoeyi]|uniref:Protein-glutamine gamma-glutamyltransferase n=1 Tax=Candidatus Venteria ishoeyi TaxID=1899563 RepID=A0A1H6F504_9GAMM|nr:DUF3488 and transglutaminase-like domain-containing protein [Candidatus Venteria ishoeyi]SEH04349.1 Protein-glutamine gamma-glutamyltransferase [Candidatus Venteria ishoeyi]
MNRKTLQWLNLSLILAFLPHIVRLPWWLPPIFLGLLFWRYWALAHAQHLPGALLRTLLTITLAAVIVIHYKGLYGRDAGIALLVGLLGLKMLELRGHREMIILIFLSYFLIMTHFLYSQSIPTALYLMLVLLITTGTLISIHDTQNGLDIRQRLQLSTRLLVQAMPLALVLFVLFPRLPTPLWGIPETSPDKALSGISESMSPGSFSELSLSDKVAFRVRFPAQRPKNHQLYWRGLVLWHTDGSTWTQGTPPLSAAKIRVSGTPVSYEITLEPHQQNWLYSLDISPDAAQGLPLRLALHREAGQQQRLRRKLYRRVQYRMQAYPDYQLSYQQLNSATSLRTFHRALQLPAGAHPKARALAQSWQEDNPNPEAIIKRALLYFSDNEFEYTLAPELMPDDPVDSFLFDKRAGFCEHYSSAFVTLMRAASIPARVVVGYQGGTINPLGDFLTVRARDAHAWTEVWLAGKGWIRIDPTAEVAPSRVNQGIATALPESVRPLGMLLDENSWLFISWQQLRYGLDAINNSWNQWVLNYNSAQQNHLLSRIGLEHISKRNLLLLLLICLGVLTLLAAWWILSGYHWHKKDPLQQQYLRFCRKLAGSGLVRQPWEGSEDFARRAVRQQPASSEQIWAISEMYARLRYRENDPRTLKSGLKTLKNLIRYFHPVKGRK